MLPVSVFLAYNIMLVAVDVAPIVALRRKLRAARPA
jgi:hypothetical protein